MTEWRLQAYRRSDRNSDVFPIRWKLGDFIRKLREEKQWTQQALADQAGVHKTAIVRLEGESGKSDTRTIENAARALGVSVADLYTHVEQATLFSNLTPEEQRHLLEYERRLLQHTTAAASPERDEAPTLDPPARVRESPAPIQKRQRR